jgi:small conductance mechanosensitive channel
VADASDTDTGNAVETAIAVITTYGLRVLGAVAILAAGWFVARLVHNAITRACKRHSHIDPTLAGFAAQASRYLILIFTLIAVLTTFGVETTSFVAVLGAAGLAIGLALQGTLTNVAAGVMLIIFRPVRVGQYVEASGIAGTVRSITLFVTTMDTYDNIRLVVPNSKIWGEIIRNYSVNDTRRLDVRIRVPYEEDAETARAALRTYVQNDSRIRKEPAPVIALEALEDTAAKFVVQMWTGSDDYFNVLYDFNSKVKTAFEQEGLGIAYPRQIVEMIDVGSELEEENEEDNRDMIKVMRRGKHEPNRSH